MTMPDLKTLAPDDEAAWAAVLGDLMEQAESALATGDMSRRLAAQESLIEFTRHCDPVRLANVHRLASGAASDLFRATVDTALGSLAARSQQLQKLTAKLGESTQQVRRAERSVRLSTALRTIQALGHAADSARELRDAMSAPGVNAPLADVINRTLADLDDLRQQIRKQLAEPAVPSE